MECVDWAINKIQIQYSSRLFIYKTAIDLPRELRCEKQNNIHVTVGHFSKVVDDIYTVFIEKNVQKTLSTLWRIRNNAE